MQGLRKGSCKSVLLAVGASLLLAAGRPPRAEAQISFVDLFRSQALTQSGNGSSLATSGFFFNSRVFSVNPGDFTAGTITYPGPGSPASMAPADASTLFFGSPLLASQAVMDADFPTGTYAFDVSGPSITDSASADYTADFYPQSLPFLDSTNYTDLQGMNAAAPFAFSFSPFTTGSGVDASFIFLTIFDVNTATLAFDAGFLAPTTSGLVLPANTLLPGHDYIYELIFSNRVLVPSPGADLSAQLGFDYRTQGRFTTSAVPEPGGAVAALGFILVSASVLRRRRA